MKHFTSFLLAAAAGFIFIMPVVVVQAQSAPADQVTTQNNADQAAIDGYCPVCVMKGELVKGNGKYVAVYKGKKYFFDTNEDKVMFVRNPELYTQGLDLKYEHIKK